MRKSLFTSMSSAVLLLQAFSAYAGTTTRELTNPLGTKSIPELIGRIATIFTGISGTVALLMFVYGGLLWLTSGGNEERIAKGKKIFTWSTIGLIVIFSAYAIVRQIFSGIGVRP